MYQTRVAVASGHAEAESPFGKEPGRHPDGVVSGRSHRRSRPPSWRSRELDPSTRTWTAGSRPAARSAAKPRGMTRATRTFSSSRRRSSSLGSATSAIQVEIFGMGESPDELAAGRAPVLVADGQGDVLDVEVQREAEHEKQERRASPAGRGAIRASRASLPELLLDDGPEHGGIIVIGGTSSCDALDEDVLERRHDPVDAPDRDARSRRAAFGSAPGLPPRPRR